MAKTGVEELAEWLHEAARPTLLEQGIETKAFKKLMPEHKKRYFAVARQLLENSPAVLRKAVRELESLA
jgi:hypothetical protein